MMTSTEYEVAQEPYMMQPASFANRHVPGRRFEYVIRRRDDGRTMFRAATAREAQTLLRRLSLRHRLHADALARK